MPCFPKTRFRTLLLLLLLAAGSAYGQDSLVRIIPLPEAKLMTTDESGNVYVVRKDNSLIRFNRDGDNTASFRSIQNGDLAWVDATNPLRILLFYPQFSKIVLLDKMLSIKAVLDLKKMSLFHISATGVAGDGNIWVYDNAAAKLIKINDQLEKIAESNDLRSETGVVPGILSLVEKEGVVYLCDPQNGLFTFDRYGAYLNTLALHGIRAVQVIGSQIIWFLPGKLLMYDLKTFVQKEISIPKDVLAARIERNRMYFMLPGKLSIIYPGRN